MLYADYFSIKLEKLFLSINKFCERVTDTEC